MGKSDAGPEVSANGRAEYKKEDKTMSNRDVYSSWLLVAAMLAVMAL
jgi:hypothetical protein